MPALKLIQPQQPDYTARINDLRSRLHAGGLVAGAVDGVDVPAIVRDILQRVESEGDTAIAELTSRLDRAEINKDNLRVSAAAILGARQQADKKYLQLIAEVAANIRDYQQQILVRAPADLQQPGVSLGVRYLPMQRVAVYVPGGQALYPSSVLMTVVPAQVAGVSEIVMFSPPTGGDIDPMVLALAGELGITEVYRAGGAVAIAAAAFGSESIRRVDKVVGPGSAFVAEAKRQLFGRVGIDTIAGPSEVLIIADDSVDPAWVAADMLAQAEHNPGASILVTPSEQLAQAVIEEVDRQLGTLERADVTRPSIESNSAVILVADLEQACRVANEFAAEHLQIMTVDDQSCLDRIRNAGAIFLGCWSPVPLGDYYAGPSHVLPTGGTARFAGPLSCNDFLKASSVISYDAAAMQQAAPRIDEFARREGLTAHARSAMIRMKIKD